MIARFLAFFICIFCVCTSFAADKDTDKDPVIRRVSLFSTSTDWEAVTGLRLSEYDGEFIPDTSLIGGGLVLYYLDGFPCYGLGEGVRVWLGPNKKHEGQLRIACVHAPTEIKFAYRNASRDADQAVTTGLLTCPVKGTRRITIDLSKCARGPKWTEYK